MEFDWDPKKRLENLNKHGLDFADAPLIFKTDVLTELDNRFEYGETRFYTIGLLNGVVVVLSQSETSISFRVISFRRADKHEEARYYKSIRD